MCSGSDEKSDTAWHSFTFTRDVSENNFFSKLVVIQLQFLKYDFLKEKNTQLTRHLAVICII